MTSISSAEGRQPMATATPEAGLAEVLHAAVREALARLEAVAAGVYFLDEERNELTLAMIAGSPPSLFTVPGRICLDTSAASTRAVALGEAAENLEAPDPGDPDSGDADEEYALPYPYAALSAPATAGSTRFGVITVLRLETRRPYDVGDRTELEGIGSRLAEALAELAAGGVAIRTGPMPMLAPMGLETDAGISTPGWGVPGVPGTSGTSMMYPLRRLADLLNRATTMDDIVGAAQYCVMYPFGAQALVLASASEGRLWVRGHSGASRAMARSLHGTGLDTPTLAARAFRGRPLFLSQGRPSDAGSEPFDGSAEAYLPLTGSKELISIPVSRSTDVIGVCCLLFPGPRDFPPEERAVLSMMAGLLGAAVERVELGAKQREIAEYLQVGLLPSDLPETERLTTAARYRPATATSKVGGDWYDVIRLSDERTVLVVGDVEGHGLESAAVMGQVRTAVTAYATEGHRPAVVLDRAGGLLTQLGTHLIVTCCVVALDTVDGAAEVALAGHPAPLVHLPDGSVGALDAPSNLPLGVSPDCPKGYQGREHTIEPGSVLMLYSDGLVDRNAGDPELRAHALLTADSAQADSDLQRLADHILAGVSAGREHRDDAVLLLARYEGAGTDDTLRTGSLHIHRRDLQGAKAARTFVDHQLSSWGLAELTDTLQLVISEIVTNALIHAGSDVDVRLRAFTDHVRLEVRDSDSNPPVPSPLASSQESNSEAEHGRGLLIVEALTEPWSSSPNGRGKTVSLNMPIPVADI
ncbi:SpoIIE family protein phosphatase [Streptomyces krungchingensis]|uniref:ATP-binding SpoIIE family protein phosphatase n=1 Tax=Streptomyces krungchingensis TaxID=1565034 RepID=UPI003CF67DFC